MAVRKIVKYGNSVLRRKSQAVTEFNDEIRAIVDDMIETMQAVPGIGLAANQVGVDKRIVVIDMKVKEPTLPAIALINPEIIESSGEEISEEGCLSFPEINIDIKRATYVKIKAQDTDGNEIVLEENDLIARILQHEIDHLNGVLFIDHINFVRKQLLRKDLKRVQELSKKES